MNRRPTPCAAAGLTLIEVLVAAFIVGSVLVSASWAMSQASSSKALLTEDSIEAALLAREIHELALRLPTDASGQPAAAAAADVVALDTLDGAVFSPPINAKPAVIATATGWSQTVAVSVYDLTDTSSAVAAKIAGATKDQNTLYKLSVTIKERGVDKGTWWWWLKS
ncbi:MAG: type IV pilus modification PilV family protein [Planctomycetota bacterium]